MLMYLHYGAILTIVIFMVMFVYYDNKNKKANPSYPSILITLGIAFTFAGVALGLMSFNTDDPTNSLANLVNGIKTAFWGSLTGVIASIVVKFHALIYLKENAVDLKHDEDVVKFYDQHRNLVENSKFLEIINTSINENNRSLILAIKEFGIDLDNKNKINLESLLGSINGSLNGIEQIQRSTQSLIAGEISELRSEFVIFAQKQAEQNTEIFIQALESAIQKFNENLVEGLGDNFKQLNEAVNRLVDWQNNYSKHVEQQTEKYSVIASQVDKVSNDFSDFLNRTDTFSEVVSQIESTLDAIDLKNTQFNQRIESFYGALDAKVVDIESTRDIFDLALKQVKAQMHYTKQTTEQIFSEINQNISKSHDKALNSQKETSQAVQQLTEQMKQSFDQTQKQLDGSLSTIETKLQQTLNQSLLTLAQQLGSLSTKFASDYEPITVNLKRLIDSFDKGAK